MPTSRIISTGKGAKVVLTNDSNGDSITIYTSSSGMVKIGPLTHESTAQAFANLGETLRALEVYVGKRGRKGGTSDQRGLDNEQLKKAVALREDGKSWDEISDALARPRTWYVQLRTAVRSVRPDLSPPFGAASPSYDHKLAAAKAAATRAAKKRRG